MKDIILGVITLILIVAMLTLVGTAIASQVFKGAF
jgi:hypothetical protein